MAAYGKVTDGVIGRSQTSAENAWHNAYYRPDGQTLVWDNLEAVRNQDNPYGGDAKSASNNINYRVYSIHASFTPTADQKASFDNAQRAFAVQVAFDDDPAPTTGMKMWKAATIAIDGTADPDGADATALTGITVTLPASEDWTAGEANNAATCNFQIGVYADGTVINSGSPSATLIVSAA